MAERTVSGIAIEEESGAEHAIARVPTSIAAFVGRTLKGPVNVPREVRSFQEFAQIFGGLWQPSTVSYAIEQFFDNGGRSAIVVRVANGARPPTLTLPAGTARVRLAGLSPGSREYLRAAVDYDGIGNDDPQAFNLVVQRVRAAGSELIEDQEIFRRLTVAAEGARPLADALTDSRLVRLAGPVPPHRPDRTPASPGSAGAGYVASNADGDDGAPLSDYDIIGSAVEGTGLFALRGAPQFSLLCIPPLSRDRDVGAATLLVAGRFCRQHQAMLIVDPPAAWTTPAEALAAVRDWPHRSDNAVMYFPRILAFDRLRGRHEVFASSAVAAGMISRGDQSHPVWDARPAEEMVLRPGLRPVCAVTDPERLRLAAAGINSLQSVRSSARVPLVARTLAAGSPGASDWQYLPARRLALFIMACIERGTRWMLLERNAPQTWSRAASQVSAFLESIETDGAFPGRAPEDRYFVICDERLNGPEAIAAGRVSLLFGFAASRPGDFHACLVTHQAGSSQVRPVSVNRLATSGRRVEAEIETAILRGLAGGA